YDDFLIFAEAVSGLEGGVVLNFGSAVMGPEVYLKALAMARNVARQEGREIRRFTTGVFDLVPLEGDTRRQAPRSDPRYYYRPWKPGSTPTRWSGCAPTPGRPGRSSTTWRL